MLSSIMARAALTRPVLSKVRDEGMKCSGCGLFLFPRLVSERIAEVHSRWARQKSWRSCMGWIVPLVSFKIKEPILIYCCLGDVGCLLRRLWGKTRILLLVGFSKSLDKENWWIPLANTISAQNRNLDFVTVKMRFVSQYSFRLLHLFLQLLRATWLSMLLE